MNSEQGKKPVMNPPPPPNKEFQSPSQQAQEDRKALERETPLEGTKQYADHTESQKRLREAEEQNRNDARKHVEKTHQEIVESDTPQDKQRAELLTKIGEVLKQYRLESNIPIDHEYWNLTARYRALAK